MQSMSLPFRYDNGVYVFEGHNFDLRNAENLVIKYDETDKERFSRVQTWTEKVKQQIKSIRASSTLDGNYSASNLLDGELNTAWVEGHAGHGVGEWVEFEFNDAWVYAIGIINGYTKNHDTYYKNSRVKQLKVELSLRDGRVIEQVKELPDREYRMLNKSTCWTFIDKIEFPEEACTLAKIRLTILEVYPGTDYQDTCISELFFYYYLQ